MAYDKMYKIILIGSSGVGKSSIINQYCNSEFSYDFISTIGIDYEYKNLIINKDSGLLVKNKNSLNSLYCKLQIWDTAGQERFQSIISSYYREAEAVVLVFDLTSYQSFDKLSFWYQQIKKYAKKNIKMILVGNKSENKHHRQVKYELGKSYSSKIGVPYIEVSAKKNINIDKIFSLLIQNLVSSNSKSIQNCSENLNVNINSNSNKSFNCCKSLN